MVYWDVGAYSHALGLQKHSLGLKGLLPVSINSFQFQRPGGRGQAPPHLVTSTVVELLFQSRTAPPPQQAVFLGRFLLLTSLENSCDV